VSPATAERGLRQPALAEAIRSGLTRLPKRLPFECLYDELGSALFEAITHLPEYGLSRAGFRLFERHADDVGGLLPGPLEIVELGSGSGRKTRVLLESLAATRPLVFYPVDISAGALADCRREVERVAGVSVVALEAPYLDGLRTAVRSRRTEARLLVLFLGSNLGNFSPDDASVFLREVRKALRPGDALLLAVDLQTSEPRLLAAYDDPIGLSAAFNLNTLARINRELDADFDLAAFRHRARWDAAERRVEMHLVSLADQAARIRGLELTVELARGETIWTESSHKFEGHEVRAMAERAGFDCAAQWLDAEWPFSQSLLVVD
jgi:dimethylhistidine N-methyltransferase